jgi:hypothetical protein
MACCLDPQCVNNPLIQSMKEVLGIEIFCSCRGHDRRTKFTIWFRSATIDVILRLSEEAHWVEGWSCCVAPDCYDLFLLESFDKGKKTYRQADKIAEGLKAEGPLVRLYKAPEKTDGARSTEDFFKYPEHEKECAALVQAMNRMPGIETFGSYRAQKDSPFKMWFWATNVDSVLRIGEEAYRSGCWFCGVAENCNGLFLLESLSSGGEANEQANEIADRLI